MKFSSASGAMGSPLSESERESRPSVSAMWKNCASLILLGMHSSGPTLTTPSMMPALHSATGPPTVSTDSPWNTSRM